MLKARISAQGSGATTKHRGTAWNQHDGSLRADGRESLDARSSCSAAELVGADLESQFAALESGSDVDDEWQP